jgi:hypothetical protein
LEHFVNVVKSDNYMERKMGHLNLSYKFSIYHNENSCPH